MKNSKYKLLKNRFMFNQSHNSVCRSRFLTSLAKGTKWEVLIVVRTQAKYTSQQHSELKVAFALKRLRMLSMGAAASDVSKETYLKRVLSKDFLINWSEKQVQPVLFFSFHCFLRNRND